MRRGDIVLVDFTAGLDHEANHVRPAIIVSNDRVNAFGHALAVVPLTSNTQAVYAFQLYLPRIVTGLDRDSKAQVELISHVSRKRIRRPLGHVPKSLMSSLDVLLAEHLQLCNPV